MSKKFLIVSLIILMLFTIGGCTQSNKKLQSSYAPFIDSQLRFSSLEELLYTHNSIAEGRASRDLVRNAENANFTTLDTIYLLANIPEQYQLAGIVVHNEFIDILYFPEGLSVEYARSNSLDLKFQFTRWSYEDLESFGAKSPLDGVMRQLGFTEEDLIDGKYYLHSGPNDSDSMLIWAYGSNLMTLYLPNPINENQLTPMHGGDNTISFDTNNINKILELTEQTVINLHDVNLISSMIGNVYKINFDYGDIADSFIPQDTKLSIEVPKQTDIQNFISNNYSEFSIPIREGYLFVGWYLDTDLTKPFEEITQMPDEDITLYAKWEPVSTFPGSRAH